MEETWVKSKTHEKWRSEEIAMFFRETADGIATEALSFFLHFGFNTLYFSHVWEYIQ